MNNIFRNAVVVTVVLAAVSLLSHNLGNAQGTVFTSTAPIRGYYLTKSTITGSKVLTACASGYHFASIWEILNSSDLHYNTTLGRTNVNSGNGAPAISSRSTFADAAYGWIRTGAPDDERHLVSAISIPPAKMRLIKGARAGGTDVVAG